MSYLRDSCCCICTKRLDKEKKPNIRKISHNNINNYRRAFPNYRKTPLVVPRTQSKFFFFLARLYGVLYATVSHFYENIFVKNSNLTPGYTPQNTFF